MKKTNTAVAVLSEPAAAGKRINPAVPGQADTRVLSDLKAATVTPGDGGMHPIA